MAPSSSTNPLVVGCCAGTNLANTGVLGAIAVAGDRFNQTYAADGATPILFATSDTRSRGAHK